MDNGDLRKAHKALESVTPDEGQCRILHRLTTFEQVRLIAVVTNLIREEREEGLKIYEQAFEQNWVVQDTIDAIRARGGRE